jgi:hypothetical protein
MAATVISICNSALTKIGAGRISALTEDSTEANVCNLRYADCRDYVLAEHNWKCAMMRVSLPSLVEAPPFGYAAYFQLPADYLRSLPDDNGQMPQVIEGGRILGNGSEFELRYIARVEDTALFGVHLAEVIARYLAIDLQPQLKQTLAGAENLFKLYDAALKKAKFLDASESKPQVKNDTFLLDSRFGGASA